MQKKTEAYSLSTWTQNIDLCRSVWIYIYIYIYICVCVCVCECKFILKFLFLNLNSILCFIAKIIWIPENYSFEVIQNTRKPKQMLAGKDNTCWGECVLCMEKHKIFINEVNMSVPQRLRVEKWSMKWKYTDSLVKKTFWARQSIKVILIVFSDVKGCITIDFLENDATVNSAFYYQLLQQNSPYLLNVLVQQLCFRFSCAFSSRQALIGKKKTEKAFTL